MNAIIPDIDTLKKVVKINATLPDEAINPYIDDAMDIYLTPYIGIKTVEKALTGTDKRLNDKILRTLGPLTLMLATPELGIRIGDSGITVENKQGTYSPANEAKIAAAKESFYFRGMQALDRLLTFLTEHPETYPEYVEHCKQVRDSSPCFIRDAREFQDTGLVNIEYSTVSCLEGVETNEEYEVVGGMGLDYIQGFLFGRPLKNKKRRKNIKKRYCWGTYSVTSLTKPLNSIHHRPHVNSVPSTTHRSLLPLSGPSTRIRQQPVISLLIKRPTTPERYKTSFLKMLGS